LKSPVTGSSLYKRWGMDVLRLKIAEIKSFLGAGKSDLQIAEEMGLKTGEYNELKAEMYAWEAVDLHEKSTEEVYIDYMLRQRQCLRDLDQVATKFSTTKQYNAIVGAIKAKSDIIEKILKTGQDMGIIDKAPEKKLIIAGVLVADLSNRELRELITREVGSLDKLTKKFGMIDIEGQLLPGLPPAPNAATGPQPVRNRAPGRPSFARGGKSKTKGATGTRIARIKARTAPLEI
jgi:hypothetical protein